MLFNSYIFICVFLPITLVAFFLVLRTDHTVAKVVLIISSFIFYGYFNLAYVPLLAGSIVINYFIGVKLYRLSVFPVQGSETPSFARGEALSVPSVARSVKCDRSVAKSAEGTKMYRGGGVKSPYKEEGKSTSLVESISHSTANSKEIHSTPPSSSMALVESKTHSTTNSKINFHSTASFHSVRCRKILLIIGILFNVALLGYFKYTNFLVTNLDALFGFSFATYKILLPLGISFFTFQEIAFLCDANAGRLEDFDAKDSKLHHFINYTLFISFFPQLIAGPICHHSYIIAQFKKLRLNFNNIALGCMIFACGLFKKVVLADNLARFVDAAYKKAALFDALSAHVFSVCYSMQLFLDFSGYCDMALGIALMFSIRLPINFKDPYRAKSIKDFWRRWHITLSAFLRAYIYIPLGGNRHGYVKTLRNLFLVFLIGGIWHGAGWTFVIWGALHGVAVCAHQIYSSFKSRFNLFFTHKAVNWFYTALALAITLYFVNFAWVFFRADDLGQALSIIKAMFGYGSQSAPSFKELINSLGAGSLKEFIPIFILALFTTYYPYRAKVSFTSCFITAILFAVAILSLRDNSSFIYFNF